MLRIVRIGLSRLRPNHGLTTCQFSTPSSSTVSDNFGDYSGPTEKGNPRPVATIEEFEKKLSKDRRNRSKRRAMEAKTRGRQEKHGKETKVEAADQFGTLDPPEPTKKTIIDFGRNAEYDYDPIPMEGDSMDGQFGQLKVDKSKRRQDDFSDGRRSRSPGGSNRRSGPSKRGKRSEIEEDMEKDEKFFAEGPAEVRHFVVKKRTNEEFLAMQKKLGEEGKIAEMVAIIDQRMVEDRVRPNAANFREAVHHLGRHGQPRKAFELYKRMLNMGIYASSPSLYLSLFNACANCSPVEKEWAINRAKLLLADCRSGVGGGLSPNGYHTAIKAFARHGELGWAFRVADFMLMDGVRPSAITFTVLLNACISDRTSGFKLAIDIWRALQSSRLEIDGTFYNGLLRACRDCGLGPVGNRVIQELEVEQRKNIQQQLGQKKNNQRLLPKKLSDGGHRSVPSMQELDEKLEELDSEEGEVEKEIGSGGEVSVAKEDTAVAVYLPETNFKLALLGGANGILQSMKKDGAKPDLKTFSLLLDLIPQHNVDDENHLVEVMRQNQVQPCVDFINSLISRRCRRREFDAALALLDECKKHNLQLNERTFSSLALGCRTRNMGIGLLRDMEALGLKPNIQVLIPLLYQALMKDRRYDFYYAMSVMSWMRKVKVQLDQSTLKRLEESRKMAEEIELKRKRKTIKKQDVTDQRDGLPPVWGLKEFLDYYEFWLKEMKLQEKSIDPKLTLLDKEVATDDLREDWEKPWVAQMEKERERERLEKATMIPVE